MAESEAHRKKRSWKILSFTAPLDERNRVTIPKPTIEVSKAKKGDKLALILTDVYPAETGAKNEQD